MVSNLTDDEKIDVLGKWWASSPRKLSSIESLTILFRCQYFFSASLLILKTRTGDWGSFKEDFCDLFLFL